MNQSDSKWGDLNQHEIKWNKSKQIIQHDLPLKVESYQIMEKTDYSKQLNSLFYIRKVESEWMIDHIFICYCQIVKTTSKNIYEIT